ncbi:MAG: hypothetical protein ACI3U8_02250 [Candidatus Onthomonas sp.]
MGLFDQLKKEMTGKAESGDIDDTIASLNAQVKALETERAEAKSSSDITPESLSGKSRSYHYKDINIRVIWKYGGQYGKTCESIGIRRGDAVDLLPPNDPDVIESTDGDPEAVAVVWHGIEIGTMKANRLRSMVHQWKAAGLPILANVSHVGGEQRIMLEMAFYGRPKKRQGRTG